MADVNLDNLVPHRAIAAIRSSGLHKVAGAMAGLDEIDIKIAAGLIGARAYMRRKQAALIAEGIGALALIRGEKLAAGEWSELMRRSFLPAVAGAGIATVPDLLQDGPLNTDRALEHAIIGGGLGLAGGMGHGIYSAGQNNPAAWDSLIRSLPRSTP